MTLNLLHIKFFSATSSFIHLEKDWNKENETLQEDTEDHDTLNTQEENDFSQNFSQPEQTSLLGEEMQ